jgi:nucleotide-binding universal stress UspA family protein
VFAKRPEHRLMKLKRILVAARGNGADEEAVKLACDLAKKSKAEIYVVYIIEVKRSLPLDAVIESEVQRAEEVLTRAEDIAAEGDYEVETDLIQAREAGSAIVDEAMQRDVDLVVMGLTYKTRFGVFDLGGAVPHVLKEAPCRVLLCRDPVS